MPHPDTEAPWSCWHPDIESGIPRVGPASSGWTDSRRVAGRSADCTVVSLAGSGSGSWDSGAVRTERFGSRRVAEQHIGCIGRRTTCGFANTRGQVVDTAAC